MSQSISEWLVENDLGQFADAFVENAVDMNVLPHLSDDDLIELGLKLGHRRKLQLALKALQSGTAGIDEKADDEGADSEREEAEHRQLTVMFCDLADSTSLSQELDLEVFREINRSYQDTCKNAIELFGGYVAKYMGDGVLAYFGYPRAHEDDAQRSIHAGLELVHRIGELNRVMTEKHDVTLGVRIGIATGLVVVGDIIGEGASRESAVVGATPNLAARIQGVAPINTIAVSGETHTLASGYFEFTDDGVSQLKGIQEPVRIWHAVTSLRPESRFVARRKQRISPIVGREDEVDLLLGKWRKATQSEGQVILVSGEPGIGKSRIFEGVGELLPALSKSQLGFQCSSHHSGNALHPIVAYFEQTAGISSNLDIDEKRSRLATFLKKSGGILENEFPVIANLMSISSVDDSDGGETDLQGNIENFHYELANWIVDQSKDLPMLCIFEDMHWADPSTIELMSTLIEQTEKEKILLFVTFRQEFSAPWTGWAHVHNLVLNRLTRAQSISIIESQTGSDGLSQDRIEEIISRSDGIPLFIEELTRAVVESMVGEDSNKIESRSAMVPATLRDSLMARLDRLDKGKSVAQCASVIGREFSRDMLLVVSGSNENDTQEGLDEIMDAEIVVHRGGLDNPRYIFRHALLQDAAYSSLLKSRRNPIHHKIASNLIEQVPVQAALVAYHLEQAEQIERALDYRVMAAEHAESNYARRESISHYLKALQLLEQLADSEHNQLRFLQLFVPIINISSYYWITEQEDEDAARYFEKALFIASSISDYRALALFKSVKGDYFGEEKLLDESIIDAEKSGDLAIQGKVAGIYSSHLGMLGRYEDSNVHIARSISIGEKLGWPSEMAWALIGSGRCFSARAGDFETAIEYSQKAIALAEESGDPFVTAWLAMYSEPLIYKGLWDKTTQIVNEYLPTAYENEVWDVVLWSSAWAAMANIKLGCLNEANSLLEKAMEHADSRVTYNAPRVWPRMAMAELLLAENRSNDAFLHANAAIEFCESSGDIPLELGAAYRIIGTVHAAMGSPVDAEPCFQQSLSTLEHIQSQPELAQSLLAYGKFRSGQGDTDGRELIKRSLEMFREMDATGWIEEACSALDNN